MDSATPPVQPVPQQPSPVTPVEKVQIGPLNV